MSVNDFNILFAFISGEKLKQFYSRKLTVEILTILFVCNNG